MIEMKYPLISASAAVTNASPSIVAIAAPGATKATRLTWGTLTISVAATGGGGVISLKDGTTVLLSFPAAAVNAFYLQFGDQGYQMSYNGALNLVAEGAVTNQASANLIMAGFTVG